MKGRLKISMLSVVAMSVGAGLAAQNAHAQASGSVSVGVGWLHIMPQGQSGQTVVESVAGSAAPISRIAPMKRAGA